mmetsp:Transcript_29100/g.79607  ORF Transcript_29100/g.79607 Transcript_29100/m.79607 type:complete len:479 (-) Transcript_29100:364-1800(-)
MTQIAESAAATRRLTADELSAKGKAQARDEPPIHPHDRCPSPLAARTLEFTGSSYAAQQLDILVAHLLGVLALFGRRHAARDLQDFKAELRPHPRRVDRHHHAQLGEGAQLPRLVVGPVPQQRLRVGVPRRTEHLGGAVKRGAVGRVDEALDAEAWDEQLTAGRAHLRHVRHLLHFAVAEVEQRVQVGRRALRVLGAKVAHVAHRRDRLDPLAVAQRGALGLPSDRRGQHAVDDLVGVAADWRREVRVDRRRESIVEEVGALPGAARAQVLRALHQPRGEDAHERIERRVLRHVAGTNRLLQRERRRYVDGEAVLRDQELQVGKGRVQRRRVAAEQRRRREGLGDGTGDRHVGEQHPLLNHGVGRARFVDMHGRRLTGARRDGELELGRVEVERAVAEAPRPHLPREGHQRAQARRDGVVPRIVVDRLLRLRVGERGGRADDRLLEARRADHVGSGIERPQHGEGEAVLARVQRAEVL